MFTKENISLVLSVITMVLVLVFGLVGNTNQLGGITNYDQVDAADGFSVDGTIVIDGSGNVDAPITSSTGTFTGLLQLDGGQLRSYTNSTSTTATAYTLVVADLLSYDSILMTPNTGALTLTFPASSTLSTLVPTAGDMQKTCIFNSTSTAATTITLAAGTGIDLESATSTLAIPANGSACLTFIRQKATASSFDITVLFDRYLDAD